jgi:hypothetical protein
MATRQAVVDIPKDEQDAQATLEASKEGKIEAEGIDTAPDGGLEAWLVAAGAFSICFCSLGFANSLGTLIEYYFTHQLQDSSPDDVAWVGSLGVFLQFAVGAISGPLFDRFGAWV